MAAIHGDQLHYGLQFRFFSAGVSISKGIKAGFHTRYFHHSHAVTYKLMRAFANITSVCLQTKYAKSDWRLV